VIDNDELSYLHVDGDESQVHPMGLNGGGNQLETLPVPGGAVDATRSTVGHARQYEDLVRAIRKGTPPAVTVRNAFESLAAIHAAYVSAALGRTIAFDDVVSGQYDDILTQFQEGAS
jgi:predicted dehydrogenase